MKAGMIDSVYEFEFVLPNGGIWLPKPRHMHDHLLFSCTALMGLAKALKPSCAGGSLKKQ
jgi:hypothetical protein